MGNSSEEQQSIFLAFHQSVRTQGSVQGTGLGRAISQRLVELLGGRVELESRPGQGSRFWFDLSLPEVGTGADPATDFLARKVVGIKGSKQRLLAVDDEPVNRQILSDLLAPLGLEIDEAEDGMQCLERCARTAFDALLLDLRLPRLSGLEVARTLRGGARSTSGKNAGVKIIAVSASVFESDGQEALDAGCDDFVPKPFQEAQLFAALGRALNVEWIFAAETVPATTTLPAPGGTAVAQPAEDRETIAGLLEFSRRGDILGLRRHLQTLLVANPTEATAAYLRRLEPLVAAYQMNRIRDVLLELKKQAG